MARQCPKDGMQRSCLLTEKVPGSIVCGGRLRNLILGLGFQGVNEVGELDGVLNKEYWRIVSHNVKVAFIGIARAMRQSGAADLFARGTRAHNSQSCSKAANVSCRVGAASRSQHGRKANKHGRLLALGAEKRRGRNVAKVVVACKGSVCAGAAGMDGSFGHLQHVISE